MDMTPAIIRAESIVNIPLMTESQKENIAGRIIKNDKITSAKGRQIRRLASREGKLTREEIRKSKNTAHGFDSKNDVVRLNPIVGPPLLRT